MAWGFGHIRSNAIALLTCLVAAACAGDDNCRSDPTSSSSLEKLEAGRCAPANGESQYVIRSASDLTRFATKMADLGCDKLVSDLWIVDATLEDLTGMERLAEVAGTLRLEDNAQLTSLQGLQGVAQTGGLSIQRNPALTQLHGLSGLTSVTSGQFVIVDNASLPPDAALELLGQVGLSLASSGARLLDNGPAVTPPEQDCSDGVDNDSDGLADCDDPDCAPTADCTSPTGGAGGSTGGTGGVSAGGTGGLAGAPVGGTGGVSAGGTGGLAGAPVGGTGGIAGGTGGGTGCPSLVGLEECAPNVCEAVLIDPCTIQLDPAQADPGQLNVAADCVIVTQDGGDGSGWSYDSPTTPTTITLQGDVCQRSIAGTITRLELVHGCPTVYY